MAKKINYKDMKGTVHSFWVNGVFKSVVVKKKPSTRIGMIIDACKVYNAETRG